MAATLLAEALLQTDDLPTAEAAPKGLECPREA